MISSVQNGLSGSYWHSTCRSIPQTREILKFLDISRYPRANATDALSRKSFSNPPLQKKSYEI